MPEHAGASKLAKAHFWLHNVGLPVFMIGLAGFLLSGNQAMTPVVAGGALVLLVGLVLFAANVLMNVRQA